MSSRIPIVTKVKSTSALTPHMVRIVLESEELRDFPTGEFTDHYVKLQLPPPGATYSVPFDPAAIKESHPKEEWHRQRTYTVRGADPQQGTITIDFVTHGSGLGGIWAADARPGDHAQIVGPGGAYSPNPEADWHLLAGDEAALPAIAVALGRLPADIPSFVILEVEDLEEQQSLEANAGLEFPSKAQVVWLHRDGADHVTEPRILDQIKSLELPSGRGHAFVHGEAGMVREVRRHLVNDRKMDVKDLSATGYWKYRRTEEGWREDKPEWNRLVELDTAKS